MCADRRCCCGSPICFENVDDFDRADSTNLGSDWHEAVGDWAISAYQLIETGTAGAKLFWTHPVPVRSRGEMHIGIEVYNHYDGAIYYLYPAAINTTTEGPVVVKFERLAMDAWEISFVGSTCTDSSIVQAPAYNPNDGLTIGCCVDDDRGVGMMRAGISAQPGYPDVWCDDADAGSGRYVGIGHGNGVNGATFDNFSTDELRKSEYPRDKTLECYNCWCWCLDMVPDRHLRAEFREAYFIEDGFPTDCRRAYCLTQSWDMDWEYNVSLSRWYGEVNVPATSNGGLSIDLEFYITCSDTDDDTTAGANFALFFAGAGESCTSANTNGNGPYYPIADQSTCEPFSLLFGPFSLVLLDCSLCWGSGTPLSPSGSDSDRCGRYYIRVTGG